MQHRRDAHRLADLAQALRRQYWLAASGVSSPALPQAMAAQPVVSTMTSFLISSLISVRCALVMRVPGVVAAHHAGHAADAAVDDVVVQRPVGGAERAAQQVVDGLVAETRPPCPCVSSGMSTLPSRFGKFSMAVRHDLLGRLQGVVLVELDVLAPCILALGEVVISLVW